MGQVDKLIEKLRSNPKDFTWDELVKVLGHFGYLELKATGRTGGSRRKFVNANNKIISLHEPHPCRVIPPDMLKQIVEYLNL